MTLVDSQAHLYDANGGNALYKLVGPAAGAHNVVVTMSGACAEFASGAIQFSNAAGTLGTPSKNFYDIANTFTIAPASTTAQLVVDATGVSGGSLFTQVANGAGQIVRANANSGFGTAGIRMSTTPGGVGTTPLGYHVSGAGSDWYATIAVAVNGL